MKSELTKLNDNLVSIKLEIPAKDADISYDQALVRISQHININGFRKGKAPRSVVEKHVGIDRVQQEALDILLPKYINQAIYDNNLDIITQPAVTDYSFTKGKDVVVTIEVEIRPEIDLGDYKNLNLKVDIAPEDNNALDKAVENYLKQHASLELVLDRPSNDTDIVVFDFDGTCNGEKIQGGSAKSYSLDLGNSNFIPGFAEQLVGHNIKDEFDIQVTFPENYHDDKLKGQPATFAIKLNEIKQRIIPELTDDFVKEHSNFSTVDELKADIQENINAQRENLKKLGAEDAIFKSLSDTSSVEIPQSMISREVNSLKADYQQRAAYQGLDYAKYVEAQGGEDKWEELLVNDAKVRIKNSLMIDKIAKVENISVEQSDLTTRLTQLSTVYGISPEDLVKQFGNNPNFLNNLSRQIINDKVRDFLIENNKFDYIEKEMVEA